MSITTDNSHLTKVLDEPIKTLSNTHFIDVTEIIHFEDTVTENEILMLIETAGDMICQYIFDDPMVYIQYDFYDLVYSSVNTLMHIQFKPMFFYMDEYELNQYIHFVITKAFEIFFTNIAPRRSYKNTFIRKTPNIEYMKKKIDYLLGIPQPQQRTTEWYQFRYKYLTASSIWKAFISDSTKNQLIYSKCKPLNIEKYGSVNVDSPLHWGQKYEDLSIKWYENMFNTTVSDFGCIPHQDLKFLAASPDGINTNIKSERYGRMVEVKNIVNREITGIPKMEYWIQMQIQMEVCNLNECDFLETRFIEYECYDDFIQDGTFNKTNDGKDKGIMIMLMDESNLPKYIHPKWGITETEFNDWETKIMTEHSKLTWVKNIYWKLDQISCVLVIRNKFWFKSAKLVLIDLWKTIEKEKTNGYEHRAPSKRTKKSSDNYSEPITVKKCFINTDELQDIVYTPTEIPTETKKRMKKSENLIINISTELFSKKNE